MARFRFDTSTVLTRLEAAMENWGITLLPTFVQLGVLKISAGSCRRNWFNEFHVIFVVKFWEIPTTFQNTGNFFDTQIIDAQPSN